MTEDFYFVRPLTGRKDLIGQRTLPNQKEKIFSDSPKAGLVISTFGAVPYVALALAVRKQLYPEIPVLVHDDGSPEADQLAEICRPYEGVEFQTNSARLEHEMGDLSAIVGGLRWAQENGLEILAKMSRRFIPLTAWAPSLISLAQESQYGTFSNDCKPHPLPMRSECFAMHVGQWSEPDVLDALAKYILTNLNSVAIEVVVYEQTMRVHAKRCQMAREWDRKYVPMVPRVPFAYWEFLKRSRHERSPYYLWHTFAEPVEYANVGKQVGLNFLPEAFMGFSSAQGR